MHCDQRAATIEGAAFNLVSMVIMLMRLIFRKEFPDLHFEVDIRIQIAGQISETAIHSYMQEDIFHC